MNRYSILQVALSYVYIQNGMAVIMKRFMSSDKTFALFSGFVFTQCLFLFVFLFYITLHSLTIYVFLSTHQLGICKNR